MRFLKRALPRGKNDVFFFCNHKKMKLMKLLLIYFCILFLGCQAVVAQKAVVRGCVTDAKTGEILSDANVQERRSGTGMATNAYGLYSISLSKGECILQCSRCTV